MAIPYTTTVTGTNIRNILGGHAHINKTGGWYHVEDVRVKAGGCLLYTSPSPRDRG